MPSFETRNVLHLQELEIQRQKHEEMLAQSRAKFATGADSEVSIFLFQKDFICEAKVCSYPAFLMVKI